MSAVSWWGSLVVVGCRLYKLMAADCILEQAHVRCQWSCCGPCLLQAVARLAALNTLPAGLTAAPGCPLLQLVLRRLCSEALETAPSRGCRHADALAGSQPPGMPEPQQSLQLKTPCAATMQVLQPAQDANQATVPLTVSVWPERSVRVPQLLVGLLSTQSSAPGPGTFLSSGTSCACWTWEELPACVC